MSSSKPFSLGGIVFVGLALGIAITASAGARPAPQDPPLPTAVHGSKVRVVVRGIPTPTAFAFGEGQIFVGGFGDEQHPNVRGGVYVVRNGKQERLTGSPAHVVGLAYRTGTLYVSECGCGSRSRILAWSGWNGRRFTKSRIVVTGPKNFTGFNGIALDRDSMLYAGVGVGDEKRDDYSSGTTEYANCVVAIDPATGEISVVATGMRQPWQPVFVPGHRGALVADLGQENLGKKRPVDRIVEVTEGADFGFPVCPAKPAACARYDKPFAIFPAHSSPMGLAALRGRLYVALFLGDGRGPEVVSMPIAGGKYRPALVGFRAPVVALGSHAGRIYVGDLTGSVYSSRP
jgi:glucose/arabinose dehydrogenase